MLLHPSFLIGLIHQKPPALAPESCVALCSPAAKGRFVVSKALENEVVLVPSSFREEDREALSLALRSEVTRVDDRWHISRPEKTNRKLQQEDIEFLFRQAQATASRIDATVRPFEKSETHGVFERFSEVRSKLKSVGGPTDDSAVKAAELLPVSRLLTEILRQTRPETFADASPDRTTIYSNAPEGIERPIPVPADMLATYLAAQTELCEWYERTGTGRVPPEASWVFPSRTPSKGNKTVLLRLRRNWIRPQFGITVYDNLGRLESEMMLTANGFDEVSVPATGSRLGLVKLSPQTKKALSVATPGSPDFRSESLDPVEHEPLDCLVKESLQLYARAKGFRTVIACVPDDLFLGAKACVADSKLDLDRFREKLIRLEIEEIKLKDTLVLRPIHTVQEEALRIDRRPIALEYKKASAGNFNTEDLLTIHASYAESYEERGFLSALESPIRNTFNLQEKTNWFLPHQVLAILGDLTKTERKMLDAGLPVPLSVGQHPICLPLLAEYASSRVLQNDTQGPQIYYPGAAPVENPNRLAGLSLYPTRLVTNPGGIQLQGMPNLQTYIKRISKGLGTTRRINAHTGELVAKTEENAEIDMDFLPIDYRGFFGQLTDPNQTFYESWDKTYHYLWLQEPRFSIVTAFGKGLRVGPLQLVGTRTKPHPAASLAEVPGLPHPTKQPPR